MSVWTILQIEATLASHCFSKTLSIDLPVIGFVLMLVVEHPLGGLELRHYVELEMEESERAG